MNEDIEKINKKVSTFILVSAALTIPAIDAQSAAANNVTSVNTVSHYQSVITKYGCPTCSGIGMHRPARAVDLVIPPRPVRSDIQDPIPITPVPVKPDPVIVRYGAPIRVVPDNFKGDLPVINYNASETPAKEANTHFSNKTKIDADGLSEETLNYFVNKRNVIEQNLYK